MQLLYPPELGRVIPQVDLSNDDVSIHEARGRAFAQPASTNP
jgi:hypothetical protein